MSSLLFVLAGLSGFCALVLDALGAHLLKNVDIHSWETATRYQLIHALLLIAFAIVLLKEQMWPALLGAALVTLGTICFSGGIYCKILTGNVAFGRIAPFGGTCYMLAWLCLIAVAFKIGKWQLISP
jgi:uncharacterized membrane protein YgdD (TMEM256/DUF423 family)